MIKKILITALAMCLCVGVAHANPTDKQKIIDYLKYFSDDPAESVLSSDGKRRYHKEYSLNKDGGVDVRIREKYLPAVTDGKNYTPKSSYFSFSPKTMKYLQKVGKGTTPIGWGLLIADIVGEGVDWVLDPENNSVVFDKTTGAGLDAVCYDFFSERYKAEKIQYIKYSRHIKNGHIYCRVKLERFDEWELDMFFDEGKQVMSEQELDNVIRDLAKAGNINAKQVILDAGKDEIADGKHDDDITRLADDITSDTAQDDPQPDPADPSPNTPPADGTGTGGKDDTQDGTKDDTKTDPNTNFELPPFCSWATVVCDFIDWVRQELPQDEPPKTVPKKGVGDIPELSDVDRYKERINFDGQCPTGQISFGIKGTQYSYVMPYTHFCELLDQLAPWFLAFTYLSTAYFIVSNL